MHRLCLNKNINGPLSLAIGVFDGIHLGHQNIIKELLKDQTTGIFTFNPHPRPNVKLILPFSERLKTLKELGVGSVFVSTKKDHVLGTSAEDFIEKVLLKEIKVNSIVIGQDFRLGKNRATSSDDFKLLCNKKGIQVKIIKDLQNNGKKLSSTSIRQLITNGDFKGVETLLGRPHYIYGIVCKGKGLGQKIGFRTANIYPNQRLCLPSSGVYSTRLTIDKKEYKSVSFVGDKSRVIIETHVPGIELNMYGKKIAVSFINKLREIERFSSVEELTKAIEQDVKNSV